MIHETAIVDKEVILGKDVSIGPYVVIEKGVCLGDRVKVSACAHIKGNTKIGDDTFIGLGAIIGEAPQMLGSTENIGHLCIGKRNIIREYVTIHTSTEPSKSTILGDDNFLMGLSHIAHDCKLGNDIVLCNGALLAGHIEVGDKAFISGNVVVHQFVRIGRLAMVGGLSRVNQDIPPFMMVVGDSRVWGLNLVGLRRSGLAPEQRTKIKKAFNTLYRSNLSQKHALAQLEKIDSKAVKEISVFILSSQRGICGPNKSSFWERIFLDYPYFLRSKITTHSLFLEAQKSKVKEKSLEN